MDDIWSTLRGAMAAAAKTYADADGGSVTRPHIMAAHGLLSNALRQEFDAAMARGYIEAVESEKPAEPVEHEVPVETVPPVDPSAPMEPSQTVGTVEPINPSAPVDPDVDGSSPAVGQSDVVADSAGADDAVDPTSEGAPDTTTAPATETPETVV
ncbi:hypothetical protein GOZ97_07445 [Agrobacterium vitis]|uniref:hypothetical protein n=1 Tax=Agrobacterium vitis TaxID=373 RepID=UPI0008FB95E1|nr:hypothetical protein [Agrobacterium vitis]MUZ53033.1 hypothetical protein [Agrobacterium vitis]MUZ91252.1 hypothetical protein [Agrobacterium vitis]MVA40304.1 hypothetical protein [Agrobacterium vitis]NSX96150.1 hypothetical protein [Agrobacterium vitis]NSZ27289.1 hypothetical protein [Agrobacterium vitis]